MNTRAKGRQNELLYKQLLESRGYLVYLVRSPQKFLKEQDIFSLFDGIAIKSHKILDFVTDIIFFQVKTNKKPSLKIYKEFKEKYHLSNVKYIIAIHYDRKGWEEIEI